MLSLRSPMAIRIQAIRRLGVPLERAWSVVSDLDAEPKYWKGTTAVRNLGREGNEVHRVVTLAFKGRESEERVTLEPPVRITYRIVGGPMRGSKVLQLRGEGGDTVIAASWDVRLQGFLKLGERFVRGHMLEGTEKALERIGQELEGETAK